MTQTTRVPWDHKPSREEIDAFALAHGIPEHLTCYVMALPQRKNVGTKADPKWETDYRPYMGVDGRLMQAHGTAPEEMSILTEILPSPEGLIIMRATVTVNNRTFQGHAASRLSGASSAEGTNPLEVAETSAVGRALGMAGYGLLPGSGIASYEEVRNAQNAQSQRAPARSTQPSQPTAGGNGETKSAPALDPAAEEKTRLIVEITQHCREAQIPKAEAERMLRAYAGSPDRPQPKLSDLSIDVLRGFKVKMLETYPPAEKAA